PARAIVVSCPQAKHSPRSRSMFGSDSVQRSPHASQVNLKCTSAPGLRSTVRCASATISARGRSPSRGGCLVSVIGVPLLIVLAVRLALVEVGDDHVAVPVIRAVGIGVEWRADAVVARLAALGAQAAAAGAREERTRAAGAAAVRRVAAAHA